MLKQQVYDIANTNIANLGSDLERQIKEASANGEPAWDGAGEELGLQIWRIEQFKVKHWPKEQYGNFYSGDSYIVMNTYVDEGTEAKKYDLHFWLGQSTTQDEAGTAAYKTVELDTKLHDVPVQHREVEGFESPLFLSYFESMGGLVTMEGGAETGFHHVEAENYPPRLLQCKGKFNKMLVKQVPLDVSSLNSGDVFVLDLGLTLFQFNGATSGIFEKNKGAEVVARLREQREGGDVWVVDESDPSEYDDAFWAHFGGKQEIAAGDSASDAAVVSGHKLYRLSDASGTLQFEFVAEGKLDRTSLDSNDVFIIDAQHVIYVWIGTEASEQEKGNALGIAQTYINENHDGLPLAITLLQERGVSNDEYKRILGTA
eukprot:TRINITY_DN53_c0_g1_i2.p1 TRINITY_DN53_c0_g1~~TRINITY_DN53_c0_g1_i2.p1  ORF type:complete len:383 (+),score=117.02 TRINITY_DN53_c0_g1_i2:33-1151(+)